MGQGKDVDRRRVHVLQSEKYLDQRLAIVCLMMVNRSVTVSVLLYFMTVIIDCRGGITVMYLSSFVLVLHIWQP